MLKTVVRFDCTSANGDGAEMLNDDELAEIRRRKMQMMMERAQQPVVLEPLANGLVNELTDANFWQVVGKTKTARLWISAPNGVNPARL
jgi:hypothetical protein